MLKLKETTNILLKMEPIDMRKSINGLSAIVADEFSSSPTSESLFIFYNKTKDKVKILYWDKNGFVLYYKRLEQGRFKFNKKHNNDVINISSEQLSWLLAGLDFVLMHKFNDLDYRNYY
jgi:transposase